MRHQLVWSQEVKGQSTGGWLSTDDSILDILKGDIIHAVPGEVCVFLEQLMQTGNQGGQTQDEGTEVQYHA